MAFSVIRASSKRFLAKFEGNLINSRPVYGKNKIYFCGCVTTSNFNVQTRYLAIRQYPEFTRSKREEKYQSESDSDVEINSNAGDSNFWRRKMRTFHAILDVNKDGVISFDDFQLLADRFVSLGHISDEKAREFRELIRKIWEKQWGEIGPYNLVRVEQYLEDMVHVVNDKDRARKVHYFLPYLFEAIDKDRLGELTLDEFKLFFECLGLSSEDAVFTFRVIDTNSDGKISKSEFLHHGKEFFLSDDESKISKYFWGPLVEK